MIETLVTLLEPRNLVVILVGIAVFATVLTVFAPFCNVTNLQPA